MIVSDHVSALLFSAHSEAELNIDLLSRVAKLLHAKLANLTNRSQTFQTDTASMAPPPLSPSNSIDTDIEYFPSNLELATVNQVNRFVELTGAIPRQARKRLHQHRHLITGEILFTNAISRYFEDHDHEDDVGYVYGEQGCFCLDNAAELVLGEIVRDVREEIGRQQRDEETLWYGVREKVMTRMEIGRIGHETSDVPVMVLEKVKETVELILTSIGCETMSLHQETFMMRSNGRSQRSQKFPRTRHKGPARTSK